MGWPTVRECYGHGVPIVVDGVMTIQGDWESQSQGKAGQVSRIFGGWRVRRMTKYHKSTDTVHTNCVEIRLTGEPSATETGTLGSEGGCWKSAHKE